MSGVVSKSDKVIVTVNNKQFDFTNVNFDTWEGMRLRFSSIEDLNEYFDAIDKACELLGITI